MDGGLIDSDIHEPLVAHGAVHSGIVLPMEKALAFLLTPKMPKLNINDAIHPRTFSLLEKSAFYNRELASGVPKISFAYRTISPLAPGSERGSMFTLIGTTLGAGIMALPFAMSRSGIILTVFLLCVASFGSALTITILILSGRYTDATSYASLLGIALDSRKTVPRCLNLLIFFYGMACIASLDIFLADFVLPVAANFQIQLSREHVIVAGTILAWPWCIPKNISALRYVSIFSIIALLATTVTVWSNVSYWSSEIQGSVKLVYFEPMNFLQTLSICIFGFMCHMNALPVGSELVYPSTTRIAKVAFRSSTSVLVIYIIIGIGGYVSWKQTTLGDFLLNYPSRGGALAICRSMLSIVAFVGVVLNVNPTVSALEEFLYTSKTNVPTHIHWILVTAIIGVGAFFGCCMQDVASLIGMMGGTFATALMFFFPAIIYYRILWTTQPQVLRKIVLGFLVVMTIVGFLSTGANMMALGRPSRASKLMTS